MIRAYHARVATTIQHYHGFIARYVGVLIYFGWPEASETDAERAVRTGLAVAAAAAYIRLPAWQTLIVVGKIVAFP